MKRKTQPNNYYDTLIKKKNKKQKKNKNCSLNYSNVPKG